MIKLVAHCDKRGKLIADRKSGVKKTIHKRDGIGIRLVSIAVLAVQSDDLARSRFRFDLSRSWAAVFACYLALVGCLNTGIDRERHRQRDR
jgi:hypothetical protein